MKKVLSVALILVLVIGVMAGCGSKDAKKDGGELVIYTWEGMFDDSVLKDFQKETGIKITYSTFDTNETMLAKLEENKGSDYDLVFGDDYIIEQVIDGGLAQKLDKDKISTLKNINPKFQGQYYDKKDEYSVPYGAGIPLILYDKDKIGFDIDSYDDLWDGRLKDNIAITGNYRVINGITLKTLGSTLNEENLDTIKKAGEKMQKLAPNIRVINDNNTQDFLLSEEVDVAYLYTSQATQALKANPKLKTAFPKEGSGFGVMGGFIPKNAPNADAAHKFLEYINQPKTAAKLFEALGYYSTNKEADKLISKDMQKLVVLPSEMKLGEMMQNVSTKADDQMQKNWNKFKKATK
ncbi:MAG: spermidine/putrescine ABC transporter substrate-binding protein [Anaerovoracaceae bacterium]